MLWKLINEAINDSIIKSCNLCQNVQKWDWFCNVIHCDKIVFELPYLRLVYKRIQDRWIELKERNRNRRDEIKVLWRITSSRSLSHDSDPLYYAIISYSRRNGAQRRSWSIQRSFLAPGLIVRTSLFLSCLTGATSLPCLPFVYFSSPMLLTWKYSSYSKLSYLIYVPCNLSCDTSIFIYHCVCITYYTLLYYLHLLQIL